MPRKEGQIPKLLVLLDIFERRTDEDHPLSVPRLVEELKKRDVPAERKSIYSDVEALRDAGYPVELRRGRNGGYYLAENHFQLAELKLLVDAVQASKFITRRKSRRLIEKLEGFASLYQAGDLKRQVLVSGRCKAQDERIYYWVDALHRAISAGRQIRFQYREWSVEKKLVERHQGRAYQVSPWALVWENGNYYLVAFTGGALRHYRVDKMARVELLDDPREGAEAYAAFDVTRYVQQMFGMFGGKVAEVRLRCENGLAGAMVDRFGTETIFLPQADGTHFDLNVTIQVSPQFFGWICGFEGGVEVLGPDWVRAEMQKKIARLAVQYGDGAEENERRKG